MSDDGKGGFGCDFCWPEDAEAAWAARGELGREARLVDESHVGVSIMACPRCSQRFVSVFTETIDWADGDDPQYSTLMPLGAEEVGALASLPEGEVEAAVGKLPADRRSLHNDFPKGGPKRIYWGKGIVVGMHD
jgi:hypothetical protein